MNLIDTMGITAMYYEGAWEEIDVSDIKQMTGFRLVLELDRIKIDEPDSDAESFDRYWTARTERNKFIEDNPELFNLCGTVDRVQKKYREAIDKAPEGHFTFEIVENFL